MLEAKINSMLGTKIGKRTLISLGEPAYYHNNYGKKIAHKRVIVRCDCGKEELIFWHSYKNGLANQCFDCYHDEKRKKNA